MLALMTRPWWRALTLGTLVALLLGATWRPFSRPADAGVPEGEDAEESLEVSDPRALAEKRAALQREILSELPRSGMPAQVPGIALRTQSAWAYAAGDSAGSLRFGSAAAARAAQPAAVAAGLPAAASRSLPGLLTRIASGSAARLQGPPLVAERVIEEFDGFDLRDGHLGYWTETSINALVRVSSAEVRHAAGLGAAALKRQAVEGLSAWKTPYADGTGWAALALVRWGGLAHDDSALLIGRALVERMELLKPAVNPAPEALEARAAAALAIELLENPAPMAYIIGDRGSKRLAAFQKAALGAHRPERLVSVHDRQEPDLLYPPQAGKTIAYVCSGEACAPPVDSPRAMAQLLETFARPERPTPPSSDAPTRR